MPQTYTSLHYHLTFATKGRVSSLVPQLLERVLAYMTGIAKKEHGILVAGGGTRNHIHLLVGSDTEASVAGFVRTMKSDSSRWIHQSFPAHAGFAWQPGYAAFTASRSNPLRPRWRGI